MLEILILLILTKFIIKQVFKMATKHQRKYSLKILKLNNNNKLKAMNKKKIQLFKIKFKLEKNLYKFN